MLTRLIVPEPHFGLEEVKPLTSSAMIYDMDAPPWWKHTAPYKDGKPVRVFYGHRVKDWYLVRDPHSPRRFYWEDSVAKVWRSSPPPLDRDIGCQTCFEPCRPEPPADTDVWSALGSSVAQLSCEQQSMIYSRLVRFIDLGWHDLTSHRI